MVLEKLFTKASHINLVTPPPGASKQKLMLLRACDFEVTLRSADTLSFLFLFYILKYAVSLFHIVCQQYDNSPKKWLQNMIIVYDIET